MMLRTYLVYKPGTTARLELMARSRTAALLDGAELLNLPVTTLRAIQLHEWS